MVNGRHGTIYTGATSNLPQRAWQHREGVIPGFTKKYHCKILAWFEGHPEMNAAIAREKQIKNYSRAKKIALIEEMNPGWRDLFAEIAQS